MFDASTCGIDMHRRFPQLHHVADAVPGIRRHGLLSAKALCYLFEVPAPAQHLADIPL